MRIKEIELSAAKNRPLPQYMTTPEICLYTSLRALYGSYRRQEIAREAAQVEKRKIISQCQRYDEEYAYWKEAAGRCQENIRRVGTLLSDIEKSENIRDIALKACEAIGYMTGDEEFLKRQKSKFKEEK